MAHDAVTPQMPAPEAASFLPEPDPRVPEAVVRRGIDVGPARTWYRVQENMFRLALHYGLRPEHRLLDLGAGSFRVGLPLLGYLRPGHYYAIEPDEQKVEVGLELVVPSAVRRERPIQVSHNSDFDFGVFGQRFDMVVARSIWSHAARWQVRKCLDQFRAHSTPGAVMLASYYPASRWNPLSWPYMGRKWRYQGLTWRGHSKHLDGWLRREAKKRGLRVEWPSWPGVGQKWIAVHHPGAQAPTP